MSIANGDEVTAVFGEGYRFDFGTNFVTSDLNQNQISKVIA